MVTNQASFVKPDQYFYIQGLREIAFVTANKGMGYSAAVIISKIWSLKADNIQKWLFKLHLSGSCTTKQLFRKKKKHKEVKLFAGCFNKQKKQHHKIK